MAAKMAGVNLRANTALLVSSNNIYSSNDVNAVIDAMTYNGFDKKGVLIANDAVINGNQEETPLLKKYYKNFLERFIVLENGKRVGINDIEIEALKTKNSDDLGFKLIAPDFTLTYTGNTEYSYEIASQYENSSVLILNLQYLNRNEGKNGLCKEDAIKIVRNVNPKLAIITHFGINLHKVDPLYEAREIQKETGCRVISANDGMIVNPISYAVEQGQKTLYKYDKKEGIRVNEYIKQEEEKVREINQLIERQTTLDEGDINLENK